MNCTAPRPRVSEVPIESAWVRLPWTTYVQISALACGCVPKPRAGWTCGAWQGRSAREQQSGLVMG